MWTASVGDTTCSLRGPAAPSRGEMRPGGTFERQCEQSGQFKPQSGPESRMRITGINGDRREQTVDDSD
ncbi:hypothetical protein F220043C3_27180 [Enterocloster asparagiformis]